jgi:ring-1,2-phenylacetyl-CoA epoxidase subunit PaaE
MFDKLSVKEIIRETPSSSSIIFDVPAGSKLASYKAGQYITVKSMIGDVDLRRSYSISSIPGEDLRIGVKKLEGGRMSTFLNDDLKAGDELEVMGPDGNFLADEAAQQHVFFVAGSGITPVMSMIKEVLANGSASVVLFYGNSRPTEAMYKSELESLASGEQLSVHWIYSQEGADVPIHSGRIDFAKATELVHRFTNENVSRTFYTCGPGEMMGAVQSALEVLGIASDKVRKEYFENPDQGKEQPAPAPQAEESGFSGDAKIKVHLDYEEIDITLNSDGDSVLNAVIDAGGDAPFSCKGGVCTTCRAKLMSGTVRMDSNFALTDSEMADGHILTCQSHPTSEEVEISYDEV